MERRKKTSGGQAIVMVTMALFAMVGLMGLAVDLGWSFFVQKQAQSAVDGAAMAAVQEAYHRMSGQFFNVTCGTGATAVYCDTGAGLNCNGVSKTSTDNVAHGCLYAASDGWCSASGSTVSCPTGWTLVGTSNVGGTTGAAPPSAFCPPTVNCGTLDKRNVPYWVQMTATETVPQLFSAILKNPTATVAASAVAGINGTSVPGSLVLLDRPGDCYTPPGGSLTCGTDINVTALVFNSITAAGPIYMASTCGGTYAANSCVSPQLFGGSSGYAGSISGFADLVKGSAIEMPTGAATNGSTWTCAGGGSPCPTNVANSSIFLDPTAGEAQPTLNVAAAAPTCGIYGGAITGTSTGAPLQLGPFNYYSYHTSGKVNGTPIIDGNPIIITGNVQFTEGGNCTAGGTDSTSRASNSGTPTGGSASATTYHIYDRTGATLQTSLFDVYFFYGGLWLEGFTKSGAATNFDPGQYVMVGTNSNGSNYGGSCAGSGTVFCADASVGSASSLVETNEGGAPTTSPSDGAMFIFTSPVEYINTSMYPGLSTQINAFTELKEVTGVSTGSSTPAKYEGGVLIQSVFSGTSLTGVIQGGPHVPSSLNQFNGVLMWQDRANSTVAYSSTGDVTGQTNGASGADDPPSGANGMNIFGLVGGTAVNGVIYQPEGAYLVNGGAGSGLDVSIQIITGGIDLSGFAGVTVNLGTPTHLLTKYSPGLLE